MATILNAAPVSSTETERKVQEILFAFYNFYFSNTSRLLAGENVTFPALTKENYIFNQAPPPKLDAGPLIHTIFTDLRPVTVGSDGTSKRARDNAILTIYVRVTNPSQGQKNAESEARFWADAVKRIFASGVQAVAQLGIHEAKLRRGPVALPSTGQQTRMLVATAKISYTVGY